MVEYLVDMRIADSGRSTTPAEGLVFIEQYVLPTLDLCRKLQSEQRIVAGGPIGGAVGLAFIIRADSARDIDDIVGGLPLWPRMVTTVTPLTTWEDRAAALHPRLERLRAGRMAGEAAQLSGESR
jgi:hypothetical protein